MEVDNFDQGDQQLNFSSGFNVTCNGDTDSRLAEPKVALHIFHACVLFILIVTSIAANSLVLLLLCKYKRLRVRSAIIVVSLIAADLLLSFTYTLPSLVTVIARYWVLTDAGCTAFGLMAYEFLMTSWLAMGMLCLDRFLNVRFPFKYKRHSKIIAVTMSLIPWIVPFIFTTSAHSLSEGSLRKVGPTCIPGCKTKGCQLYFAAWTTGCFIIGGLLPLVVYMWMCYKGRRRLSLFQLGDMVEDAAAEDVVVENSGLCHSTPERRAVTTFLLLLTAILITSVPSFLVISIRGVSPTLHCQIPLSVIFLLTELFMSASTLNALVIMRDQDFRYCIKDLFFCCNASLQTRDAVIVSRGDMTSSIPSVLSPTLLSEPGLGTSPTEVRNGSTQHDGHNRISEVLNGAIPCENVFTNNFSNAKEAESLS